VAPALADALSPVPSQVPDAVLALMEKIAVESDDALLADYPRAWPARVSVTTAGRSRERRVALVPGDPAQPFTAEEVEAKFRRFVAPALGDGDTQALLQAASALIDDPHAPASLLQHIARIFRGL
jgi:2-methylcitrate dehydratase PrpD